MKVVIFVDTGLKSTIAERLVAVGKHLEGEDIFLANYSDGLTDFPLPELVEEHKKNGAVASFLCIKPYHSFHCVETDEKTGRVTRIQETSQADFWGNGGYFVLSREIYEYVEEGDGSECGVGLCRGVLFQKNSDGLSRALFPVDTFK